MSAIATISRVSGSFFAKLCAVLCAVLIVTSATHAAATEKILYVFRTGTQHGKDGANPNSTLIFDGGGSLYGTTEFGGIKNGGTVFELIPQPDGTWQESILHWFTGATGAPDGYYPFAGLVFDGAGNLYGTTAGGTGGADGYGTVFELTPGAKGWTETVIHTFGLQSGDGQYPEAPLTLDGNGNIYGTTYMGRTPCDAGTVFQFVPNLGGGWTENQPYCFSGEYNPGGAYVIAGVTLDTAGNLYGTTFLGGGSSDNGVVYQLTPSGSGWTENVLYTFGANAWHPGGPYGGVILDRKGNLYGTDPFGGVTGYGSVYELKHTARGWKEITLYSFLSGDDGAFPEQGNLVFDKAGNLYGTTGGGGGAKCGGWWGCGTVFELTPTKEGWQETILHSFQGGADGAFPDQGLVLDSQGNLYGTTFSGGDGKCNHEGCGTVFEITP